ncbi:MAG TPA: nickel pincer cofactor biosynthesis protein LarC [Blastocatellia bacterium]|nr:nickel pincer cofactor biosynthesis protein LarC [Blastocatellia bacterium]
MRTLYFDCSAGVSGDMIVGALINLGVDIETLKQQLSALTLTGYEITAAPVKRSSITAIKFDVGVKSQFQPRRHLADITEMLYNCPLSDRVKWGAIGVFRRLAEAEARVHGTTPEQVHFHEVGAVDSIIDIVAAMIGFEALAVERFFASAVRTGHGMVVTAHGPLPIPAPATAELLRGVPTYAGDMEGEFATPTGAAIITSLCESYGPAPNLAGEIAGYGAGTRDPEGFSNALRLVLGELFAEGAQPAPIEEESAAADQPVTTDADAARIAESFREALADLGSQAGEASANLGAQARQAPAEPEPASATSDAPTQAAPADVMVVETNIDDMNPQAYGFVMERAMALGALDVFMTPVHMKKDRPGVLLTVICEAAKLNAMTEMLLTETTTLGVRYYEAKRRVLDRTSETVETKFGAVRVKVARDGNRTLHFQPEYEDCARLAQQAGVPLLEVQAAASSAYRERMKAR